eukprot:s1361_g7.t1
MNWDGWFKFPKQLHGHGGCTKNIDCHCWGLAMFRSGLQRCQLEAVPRQLDRRGSRLRTHADPLDHFSRAELVLVAPVRAWAETFGSS